MVVLGHEARYDHMIGKGPVNLIGLISEQRDRFVKRACPKDAPAHDGHGLGRGFRRIERDNLAGRKDSRAWRPKRKAPDILQRPRLR